MAASKSQVKPVARFSTSTGAKIAIVGLHHKPAEVVQVPSPARGIVPHHRARCTIMHLLATGLTPEGDWPYATGLGPLTALWIRDSDGRWHATRPDGIVSPWGHNGSNPWTDTRMVTAWLRIIPPLNRGTAWIEISAADDRLRSGPPYRSAHSNPRQERRAVPPATRPSRWHKETNRPHRTAAGRLTCHRTSPLAH